jgi:hypothetical protein
MRALAGIALVSFAALTCAGCLRTTYNHCTEMPPDRECEALDSGIDGGPDVGVDAAVVTDAGAADVGSADGGESDAGTDAP